MRTILRAILLAQLLACCLGQDSNLQSPPSVAPPTVFPGLGSRTIFPPNFGNDLVNRALGLTTTTTTTTTTVAPFPGISVQRPIVLPTVFPDNFGNDFLNRLFGRGNASTTASTTAPATTTTQSPISMSSTVPTTTATATTTTGTTNPTSQLIASALGLVNQLLMFLFGRAPAQG